MRKRILAVVLSAVLLAVVLFGVPLAVAVSRMITANEQGELERAALGAAVEVSPGYRHDKVELPHASPGVRLGLYDRDGNRVAGAGPRRLIAAAGSQAINPSVVTTETNDEVISTVPVSSGEKVIAVARAASSRADLRRRIWLAWLGLGGLACAAVSCAGLLAAAQSRRLSRPLIALEQAATELGGGNLGVRTTRSGVPEIDRTGESLDRTASRLTEMIARERDFSANASHQLRTPLTTLRLHLETGLQSDKAGLEAAAAEAIRYADQLEQTIDDVLALARGSGERGAGFEIQELFAGIRERWHGTLAAVDRPLRLVESESLASKASLPATRQIIEVLLDNAYRHGKGAVTVLARAHSEAVAIDVVDEGDPSELLAAPSTGRHSPPKPGTGLGLPLARSLAEAEGGRLLLARDAAQTRITVLLPLWDRGTSGTTDPGLTYGPPE